LKLWAELALMFLPCDSLAGRLKGRLVRKPNIFRRKTKMAKARIDLLCAVMLTMLAASLALWSTPAAADDAAATYKAKCAMCHGADGKGDTPMGKKLGLRDFTSPEVQKMSDDELIGIITKGKNKMPAYENKLSTAQIKDVVTYIRQLAKGK
jgi:cytochrome c6